MYNPPLAHIRNHSAHYQAFQVIVDFAVSKSLKKKSLKQFIQQVIVLSSCDKKRKKNVLNEFMLFKLFNLIYEFILLSLQSM